jgi:hypothetical protein
VVAPVEFERVCASAFPEALRPYVLAAQGADGLGYLRAEHPGLSAFDLLSLVFRERLQRTADALSVGLPANALSEAVALLFAAQRVSPPAPEACFALLLGLGLESRLGLDVLKAALLKSDPAAQAEVVAVLRACAAPPESTQAARLDLRDALLLEAAPWLRPYALALLSSVPCGWLEQAQGVLAQLLPALSEGLEDTERSACAEVELLDLLALEAPPDAHALYAEALQLQLAARLCTIAALDVSGRRQHAAERFVQVALRLISRWLTDGQRVLDYGYSQLREARALEASLENLRQLGELIQEQRQLRPTALAGLDLALSEAIVYCRHRLHPGSPAPLALMFAHRKDADVG